MKRLALIAGVALLASCGPKAPAPEATASADASIPMDVNAGPSAAPVAAATPGSYDVTNPDGKKTVDTLMADGTYVTRDDKDKVIDKGKWTSKDGKTCFTPEGKTEECYAETPRAADGSFSATGPDGKVTQVKPHAKM